MNDSTFLVEFIGGSQDGLTVETVTAPDHVEVKVNDQVKELYQRENNQPPFVYVQMGYAENETWK